MELSFTEREFRAKRTFFNRSQPSNLLTIEQWKTFTRNAYKRESWMYGVRKYVDLRGGAHVLQEDGTLLVFTKRNEILLECTPYPIGTWGWENNIKEYDL